MQLRIFSFLHIACSRQQHLCTGIPSQSFGNADLHVHLRTVLAMEFVALHENALNSTARISSAQMLVGDFDHQGGEGWPSSWCVLGPQKSPAQTWQGAFLKVRKANLLVPARTVVRALGYLQVLGMCLQTMKRGVEVVASVGTICISSTPRERRPSPVLENALRGTTQQDPWLRFRRQV